MPKSTRFVPDEARYLVQIARQRETVTYGVFAAEFGLPNQCGPQLSAMCERLAENGLPLLPVLVVTKGSTLPSPDAGFYAKHNMDESALRAEQERCFEYDWAATPFV
ncbi:hypothetical protein [Gymnodinialimonas sp.]